MTATLAVHLRLGRVSNLPTVWTNVLTGVALAGAPFAGSSIVLLLVAISLLYTAGMYLNDGFDRQIDARERPERPIPSGRIAAVEVFAAGFALLAIGVGLVAAHGRAAGAFALLLAGAIVLYDFWHKGNPVAPLLMGSCRMLVPIVAALAVAGAPTRPVSEAAIALFAYVAGMTYLARDRSRSYFGWPVALVLLPVLWRAPALLGSPLEALTWIALLAWTLGALSARDPTGRLIAGISLLDAALLAATGSVPMVALALSAAIATRAGQRLVRGT